MHSSGVGGLRKSLSLPIQTMRARNSCRIFRSFLGGATPTSHTADAGRPSNCASQVWLQGTLEHRFTKCSRQVEKGSLAL